MSEFVTMNLDPRVNAGASHWLPPEKIIAVAAGGRHNLALAETGSVFASGDNEDGQCDVPTGLNDVVAIAAGFRHSLAVKADGTIVCWGSNDAGQLNCPPSLADVVAVTAGVTHSVALRQDGSVVCWGLMKTRERYAPPEGLASVIAVDSGWWSTYALTADGRLVAWGTNAEFGPVAERPMILGPDTASKVVAISVGHDPFAKAAAVMDDGSVVEDRDGRGTFFGHVSEDLGLGQSRQVKAVAVGQMHRVALLSSGTIVGWGGSAVRETPPAGATDVVAVSAGCDHTLALRADGTVIAWGKNGYGQLEWPKGFTGEITGWQSDGYYLKSLDATAPAEPPTATYAEYDRAKRVTAERPSGDKPSTSAQPKSDGGCYIATAVYGSYDAAPVRTLRSFRDEELAATAVGRAFIRAYYAVSPVLARRLNTTSTLSRITRAALDRVVARLDERADDAGRA